MKRQTIKFCSVVLVLTMLMSMCTFLTSNATETNKTTSDTVAFEDENYCATGDLTAEYGLPDSVVQINTAEDYYKVVGGDNSKFNGLIKSSGTLPESVDHSQSIYFPEIGDQGQLGSCGCWAGVYYQFTYTMNKEMGVATTPENSFSPKWTYNLLCGGYDSGTAVVEVYTSLKEQGAVTLSQVPYDDDYISWSPQEEIWRESIRYRLKDYQELSIGGSTTSQITSPDDSDLSAVKTALSNGDILTFSTYVYSWEYTQIKENSSAPENEKFAGEDVVTYMSGRDGGHRMTIVGYNDNIWTDINENNIVDDGEMGAFKIANSWGTDYSNNGYVWVAYDAVNLESSVEGVSNTGRVGLFNTVSRIDVRPYNDGANLYLKYTLNSSDRSQTKVDIIAEKDGTEYTFRACPAYVVLSTTNLACSYDGSSEANDGTFVSALDNVLADIDSENFDDYTWTVKFTDSKFDGKTLTVKDAEIVDENENIIYKSENTYPVKLNGTVKNIQLAKTRFNHAAVYYRGYDNPIIHYKVGDGEWVSESGIPMEENREREGYIYKYVIDLAETDNATLYFTDGNGNTDDNDGEYYKAYEGVNYYITAGAQAPLQAEIVCNDIPEVDRQTRFTASASGGYGPYQYQFITKNLNTGETTTGRYFSSIYKYEYFRTSDDYRLTVNVKDYAGTVATTYIDISVEDHPFEFSELKVNQNNKAVVGEELQITAVTNYEHIIYAGQGHEEYDIVINKGDEVYYSTTVLAETFNYDKLTSTVKALWTPTQTGEYTVTISSYDYYDEYAEKTVSFEVMSAIIGDSNSDGIITVTDATQIQKHIIETEALTSAQLERADADKDGKVSVRDATYIQKYISSCPNYAYVGEVLDEEIPEPTEPTTVAPTTVAPTTVAPTTVAPTTVAPTTVAPTTVPPTTVAEENLLTFTNSLSWGGTIYCYYWSDSNTSMTTWPGKAMTYLRTNSYGQSQYTFEIPEGAEYIIISNGSSQTVNIPYAGGEVRYYALSTTDSKGRYNVEVW